MPTIKTKDGTEIYYGWGTGLLIVQPCRCRPCVEDRCSSLPRKAIAPSRMTAAAGCSGQPFHGNDRHLCRRSGSADERSASGAVHVGHSTGGGEARYIGTRHGRVEGRTGRRDPAADAETPANPEGTQEAFDGLRASVLADRSNGRS